MKTETEIKKAQTELNKVFREKINATKNIDMIECIIYTQKALETLFDWILEKKK